MDRDIIKYVILKYIDKSIRVMTLEYYKISKRDFNRINITKVEFVELSKEDILKRYPNAKFIEENINGNALPTRTTLIGRIANVFKKKDESKNNYTDTKQIAMTTKE